MLLGGVARVGQVVGEGSARRDGSALERVDLEAARDHDAVRRVAVQAPVVVGVVAARVRTIPRPEEIVWTCQRAPLPPQLAGRVPDAVWAATFDAVAQRVAEDNEMRVRALNTLGGPMIPCCVCCRVCKAFASVGKIQEEQQRSDQAWLALAQGEQAKYAPYGVHVALATETRVSGGDDTRVRTREVNVGLKFETADPVDGVVVEAPALQEPIERAGIASELEALGALHQKGALTDGEFAAAKAKLLG